MVPFKESSLSQHGTMPTFVPRPGAVLLCDFTGHQPPEMTKVRPVVVISPRFRHRIEVYAVVPLSTTSPRMRQPYHHRITAGTYPFFSPNVDVWAKAHLLVAVAPRRLRPLLYAVRTGERPKVS